MFKKLVCFCLALSCYNHLFHAVTFMDKNYDCPENEKYDSISEVEKIMYGDFKPRFTFDFIKAMPTDQKIKVEQHIYESLRDNALNQINTRRTIVKRMIEEQDDKNHYDWIKYLLSYLFFFY
ncbi:MAG TPA: hypothetical protein VLB80_02710 [Candidatus Babeliales bacterium]|nr:hypothetical protein [Candidatus Babeliales bacterium]